MTAPVRVLLAEDHAMVRAGLRAVLEKVPAIEVVGEARDGNEALQLIVQLEPDVVLMDVAMPGLGGIEAASRAAKLRPRSRILMVSMYAERDIVRQALLAGASGYVLKSDEVGVLAIAIAAVARGEEWLSPAVTHWVIDDALRTLRDSERSEHRLAELTARQREVLRLVADGLSTKEVAARLGLSVKTVETHRAQIMQRLGVPHLAGLIGFAIRTGLVSRRR